MIKGVPIDAINNCWHNTHRQSIFNSLIVKKNNSWHLSISNFYTHNTNMVYKLQYKYFKLKFMIKY